MEESHALQDAAWSAACGIATAEQAALLEADPAGWRLSLERLIGEIDGRLGDGDPDGNTLGVLRTQFQEALDRLSDPQAAAAALRAAADVPTGGAEPAATAQLHATWDGGRVVVWLAGRGLAPGDGDQLSDCLQAVDAPPHGWAPHRPVPLPDGSRAAALSIDLTDALGWLVTVARGSAEDGIGPSLRWVGQVSLAAVDAVAQGRVVPTLRKSSRPGGRVVDLEVAWVPAAHDEAQVKQLVVGMPGAILALGGGDPTAVVLAMIEGSVEAIVRQAARQVDLPATPPKIRTRADVAEAVVARLDGSPFDASTAAGASVTTDLAKWVRPVVGRGRTKLIAQLRAPDASNVWVLSILAVGPNGQEGPIAEAPPAGSKDPVDAELARLERLWPVLQRTRDRRRGEVGLTQTEAWEFMTEVGPVLRAAGFGVRVPALSRRRPTPALRLFAMPSGPTAVGAAQLSDVRWSVLFDDVELTAADIARLAAQARPLVQSRGQWVELDRADLQEAAAALAERETTTSLTGSEILRHAVGLEASQLAGGVRVEGTSWATDILEKAQTVNLDPVTSPPRFRGELRSYQGEALSWLGFLDAVGLGGCLALDMGLGKTPTMLAHLAATTGQGPSLVIAPPAVVGNWVAEAAKFTPELSVTVHHGASRASAAELEGELAGADVVITTYATAVRDIDALAAVDWDRVVLDEAQAVKNPASDTAQQLRRLPGRSRIALTGTPIENGLGDLWSILDFINPGLVGSRPAFVAQLSGDGEAALRALNGVLVFRRTKAEPFVAAELPDHIDELDHCTMTPEQIGLYQAVLDQLVSNADTASRADRKGAILTAITKLKQICNHPAAYHDDGRDFHGRSGKLARLEEIVEAVFAAEERILVFTHFAEWGKKMAAHLSEVSGLSIPCYHGGLARGARDRMIKEFQEGKGAGALVLSLKAGGTGLNLTAASHVVLYDRWWNPAVEDQARDRAWRLGQKRTVVSHRLVCPGTVDERVEEIVAGKRHIADVVLPKSSTLADLDTEQLRTALGLRTDALLTEELE
jgi:hypothetical protein